MLESVLIPWGPNASGGRLDWREISIPLVELVECIAAQSFLFLYDREPAATEGVWLHDFAWPALLDAGIRAVGAITQGGIIKLGLDSEGRLTKVSGKLEELLALVGMTQSRDVHKAPIYSEPLLRSLEDLYGLLLAIPRVGPAVTTKLLHRKAPGLIPILDRRAVLAYGGSPESKAIGRLLAVQTFMAHGAVAINKDWLVPLQEALSAQPELPPLTLLRIYDIVCWLVWDLADEYRDRDDCRFGTYRRALAPLNWEIAQRLVSDPAAAFAWALTVEEGSLQFRDRTAPE